MDELEAELSDTQIAEKLKLLANELVAELSKCKDFPLLSQLEESTENNSNSSSCETYLTKPGNRADAIPPTFGEAVDDSEGNADALDQGIEIRGGITQDEIPCDAENSSPGGSTREITSNSLHLVDSDIASPIAVPENNISQKIQEERNDSYQCNERRDSSKHPNEKTTSRRRKKVLCICGKLFHTWYLKHHLRSCRGKNEGDPYIGKRVSCPECGRTIAASSLLRHKKSCKHKFLSNISVPDKCVHPSSNFAHYMKMHGKPCQAVLVNSFREFVPCPKCRIKVKKQNLFSHMKNSCKAKKLLLLNNCFPNKVVLSQPTSQGGGSKVRIQVQCKHCGKHLTMSNFSSHLRTHAEEETFSRSPLSLSCSLSFDIKSAITRKCTYSPSL